MNGADTAAPAPAFLYDPPDDERREQERVMAADTEAEALRQRDRRWKGRVGWAAAAALGATALAQAFTIAALVPLQRVEHRFTHVMDDGVVATLRSSNDLPESKREQLILATAAYYVRRCEKWNWFEVAGPQGDYALCDGLSYGERKRQYAAAMDNQNNPRSPERVYGREGYVRSITGTAQRVAPNAIRVPYLKVSQKPGERRVEERLMAYLDYVPVTEIPAQIRLSEPMADILFGRMTIDADPQARTAAEGDAR